MITVGSQFTPSILRDWNARLEFNLRMAIEDSCMLLKEIAREEVDQLDAHDTYAFRESLYISVPGFSDYAEAADAAADAYMNNETMWPEIKQVFGDVLKLDDEIRPSTPWEGYLGVAAFHGRFVEFGYVSFYKNDVAPRPVIGNTAVAGRPFVLERFRRASNLSMK